MVKVSFQHGLRVSFMALVVCVCSPSTVTTAKGLGNPINRGKKEKRILINVQIGRWKVILVTKIVMQNKIKKQRSL
jgi:hypothetical protein